MPPPPPPEASPLAEGDLVVVKVGSSLLVDPGKGDVRADWLDALADDLADLHRAGKRVLVVSSGAIGLGREALGFRPGRLRLEESQAAASIGQIRLAHRWQSALARHQINVAQILLTLGDTEDRRRFLNARATIEMLWRLGAIPVVNENDTVATSEIRFGDNDRLAARVAQMMMADCLVLLSDVDGLYDADPRRKKSAKLVPWVEEVTPEIEAMAGLKKTEYGSGGMRTKLLAARIASHAGCAMAIARGIEPHPIRRLLAGAPCTWFAAVDSAFNARKSWIAASLQPLGALIVDKGAKRALDRGRSLLPAGVTAVTGEFDRGDPVIVADAEGWELGRGLCAYSSDDARTIAGHRSREITRLLGYRGRDEIIHRDDLVVHSTGPWLRLPPELRTADQAREIQREEAEAEAG
ncbi:glutamate 5-kinase [Marinibaculum pumilum]|uniref:Glutamate 5-kinase n=1 Tax=Marinibaculum pumilum TaxID=1766165 RepID=A0ABV7L0Z6_9PROT